MNLEYLVQGLMVIIKTFNNILFDLQIILIGIRLDAAIRLYSFTVCLWVFSGGRYLIQPSIHPSFQCVNKTNLISLDPMSTLKLTAIRSVGTPEEC